MNNQSPESPQFARDQVAQAANSAADTVLAALQAGSNGMCDTVNLLVNLTLARLDNPEVTLEDAIALNYDEDVETVLDWCLN